VSDTEVLLQAYVHWGEAGLERLNGMFSFAIWDAQENRLFAARDRLGIKPFYYFWNGHHLLFASEIKAILQHPVLKPAVDHDALQDYMNLQYCMGDKTLFKGIKRLEPGCSMVWQDANLTLKRYWNLAFPSDGFDDETKAVNAVQETFADAVRLRLRSDVPLGSHLSGGLDSSAIACQAVKAGVEELQVFCGGFKEDPRYDETFYARHVADSIGAQYHEIFPQAADLADSFEDMIYYLDEPVAGAAVLPQYYLSRLARNHVKVVLGGQGADEVFGGYARYLLAYMEGCMRQAVYGQQTMTGSTTLASLSPNLSYLRGYEPLMQSFLGDELFSDPAQRYYRILQATRYSPEMDEILPREVNGGYSTWASFESQFNQPQSNALMDRMAYMDIKDHLQSLLHLEDRTSMAVGLESRLPFLDHRLVEIGLAIPADKRFAHGKPKHILRQAVAGLVPRKVLKRRDKMGFPVPIFEWFKGELKPFVQEILLGHTTRQRGFFDMPSVERLLMADRPYNRAIWGLLSLEIWFRRCFDRPQG
jgi:asparagine synthase (glutamine-hydrolysing)